MKIDKGVTLGGLSFGSVYGVAPPVADTTTSNILVYRDLPVETENPITGSSPLGPITYALVNELPTGLVFNSDGTISGESQQVVAASTFTVEVTDIFNQVSSNTFTFTSANASGQTLYTTPGTYTFTVPDNVFAISVITVGAGGSGGASYATSAPVYTPAGGGGGGGLGYKNNITVTPGQQFTVVVGAGGASVKRTTANTIKNGNAGGDSSFDGTTAIGRGGAAGQGGTSTAAGSGGNGGTYAGDGGGDGGSGGSGNASLVVGGGGGGAGGYAGNGGAGGAASTGPAMGHAGSGGAAGGGSSGLVFNGFRIGGASGGGVGLLGQGTSGADTALPVDTDKTVYGGRAGSNGTNGSDLTALQNINYGCTISGAAGGGGGGESLTGTAGSGAGANGAVRIVWQGNKRYFPTTRTASE